MNAAATPPLSMPLGSLFRPVSALLLLALATTALLLVSCKKQKAENTAEIAAPKARIVEIADETDTPPATPAGETPIDPTIPELKVNKSAQVGILCYHDFITAKSNSQMRINIDHFRIQMQSIKDARLPVISLQDFVHWRHGEKDIPDSSVMITIDDGYESVHSLAMPVLKEFGFPFSVFLYKKYVNGGGRALTTSMVKDILNNGGDVGSHSVSHPLNIARVGNRTPEEYEQFLVTELRDSKQFLEDMFMRPVPTYAHPGGTYTPRILELGTNFGYQFMFSVNPAKATWESPAGTIPRYVVLGNDPNDHNFKAALSFRGISEGGIGRQLLGGEGEPGEDLVATDPKPNAVIAGRRPLISVDVSKLEGIDPASVAMKIGGFGAVPFTYNALTKRIAYQVVEPLRTNEVHVHVSFQRTGQDKPDMVSWKFFIDLIAHYLPEPPPTVDSPKAVPVMETSEPGQAPESGTDGNRP
ncbi:MAG: polysaccharide deacetylase family protein [Verrucomicrobiales bacterium]|nr:polysaccharide deacetylase family protein [Verrucomicrobiales bacterium]